MYKYGLFQVEPVEFEWNDDKRKNNIEKHGIDFSLAVETFEDLNGLKIFDQKHSAGSEERFYWIGATADGRILTTWFTMRNNHLRIIGSAQLRKFRRLYENSKTKRRQD